MLGIYFIFPLHWNVPVQITLVVKCENISKYKHIKYKPILSINVRQQSINAIKLK